MRRWSEQFVRNGFELLHVSAQTSMNVIPGENAWRQRPFVSAIYAAQEANCIKIRRDSVTDIMRDRELSRISVFGTIDRPSLEH